MYLTTEAKPVQELYSILAVANTPDVGPCQKHSGLLITWSLLKIHFEREMFNEGWW